MSTELRVMLHPNAAYSKLVDESAGERDSPIRRPLFFVVLLGCVGALLAEGFLNPRLVVSLIGTWAFLPVLQIFALALPWVAAGRPVPIARAIDLFFAGFAPWMLWLLGVAAYASTSPPPAGLPPGVLICLVAAAVALLWSLYIDFCFFRQVLQRSRSGAVGSLLLQRLSGWFLFLVIFGGGSLWSGL